jgi:hypothetical protein
MYVIYQTTGCNKPGYSLLEFENGVIRVYVPKGSIKGGWRKLYSDELCVLSVD